MSSKSSNSAVWSGEQCVEEFLGEIKSGKIKPTKLMILWFSEGEDGRMRPHRWFANMSRTEEIALLQLAIQMGIEDWKE